MIFVGGNVALQRIELAKARLFVGVAARGIGQTLEPGEGAGSFTNRFHQLDGTTIQIEREQITRLNVSEISFVVAALVPMVQLTSVVVMVALQF